MNNLDSNRRLLMERSVPGRVGTVLPPLDVPEQPLPNQEMLRGGSGSAGGDGT